MVDQKPAPGRITGIGGIFFKAKDPKALALWYQDTLGFSIEDWGGTLLHHDALDHPPVAVWNPFTEDTQYFAPSTREMMVNFAVDDLNAFLARLTDKGITILGQDDQGPVGKFAWIMDPEGLKIELWEPAKPGKAE